MDNGQGMNYGPTYDKSQQFRPQQQQQRAYPPNPIPHSDQLHHHHRPQPSAQPPHQQQQSGHSHSHSHSHQHQHPNHSSHHHHSRPQDFGNGQGSSNGGNSSFGGGFEQSRFSAPSSGPPPPPVVPRIPLADRDVYMLSLASQDSPSYYDPTDSSSSETDQPIGPLITNRGNKLLSSARNVRRGRLGSYPHTEIGFHSPSATKRRKTSSSTSSGSGFAVAPNLHLVKRRSPSPPALAILPPAAQSPLDLLLASATQSTLGPKNQIFKTLAMSSIGLIEQEGGLIGSLRRVCAGLRGEGFEFRLEGDEEMRKEKEEERIREELEEDERLVKLEEIAAAEAKAQRELEEEIKLELERKLEIERIEREVAEAALEAIRVAEEEKRLALEAEARAVEEEKERVAKEAELAEAEKNKVVAVELEEGEVLEPVPAPEVFELPPNRPIVNGISEDIRDPALLAALSSLPALADLLPPNEDITMNEINPESNNENDSVGEGAEEEEDEPTRRRSGRVVPTRGVDASHDPSHEESISESDQEPLAPVQTRPPTPSPPSKPKRIAVETLPEYAQRLVDPEIFVRSLFVSEGDVGVPVAIQGGPAGSLEVDVLSPNEQEVMVHDCLTDLHRFLADSLEYRARLEEIRDGVLGIERRRKGMWKVVRMVAADWIEEENF